MKAKFRQYLQAVGMTKTLIARVAQIEQFYRRLCPDELNAVFVSEYVTQDGGRQYESLWFFSESCVMEAKQFLTADDFDIMAWKHRLVYFRLLKTDYDFEAATDKSRMNLTYGDTALYRGELKASRENCDYLRDIYLSLMVPNLITY
jgi:hypothetical protein